MADAYQISGRNQEREEQAQGDPVQGLSGSYDENVQKPHSQGGADGDITRFYDDQDGRRQGGQG